MEPTVGQTVVHPQHGTATVTGFETREIRGTEHRYIVLRRQEDELTVRIPTELFEDAGVRSVMDRKAVGEVLQVLRSEPESFEEDSWRQQHARHERRVGSGEVREMAAAIRDLHARRERRGLSPTDSQLYREARDRLTDEIVAATGDDPGDVVTMIDDALA